MSEMNYHAGKVSPMEGKDGEKDLTIEQARSATGAIQKAEGQKSRERVAAELSKPTAEDINTQIAGIEEEVAGYELELSALQSMEEKFIAEKDPRMNELLEKELQGEKEKTLESINAYILGISDNRDEGIKAAKRNAIAVRNKIFNVSNMQGKLDLAA